MCQNTMSQTTRALFLGGGGVLHMKLVITFKTYECQTSKLPLKLKLKACQDTHILTHGISTWITTEFVHFLQDIRNIFLSLSSSCVI